MTVPFRQPHRVSYAECTVGNHVYYSRYLDWLEAARGEFIRSLGLTVLQWQECGFIFPVIEARLRYKSPARYDDWLTIEVWPAAIERVRLNFAHRIINQDGKLILEAKRSMFAPRERKTQTPAGGTGRQAQAAFESGDKI